MGTPTTFLPPLEKDQFAPALFKKMSGAEKLSSPSCQPFDAGFTLNPDTVAVGDMPTHQVTYDTEIVDNNQQVSPGDSFALTLRHLLAMLARSATARGGYAAWASSSL